MKESMFIEQKTELKTNASKKEQYQGITVFLKLLMIKTRLDIRFATFIANLSMKNPGHQHIKVVKTISQYLKESRKRQITYSSQSELLVEGYSDFDWARDKKS